MLRFLVVFIAEITARAFIVADSNKRRTLSRADIAKALSKSDQFDFLIDIVPREEIVFPGASNGAGSSKKTGLANKGDQVSLPIVYGDAAETFRRGPVRSRVDKTEPWNSTVLMVLGELEMRLSTKSVFDFPSFLPVI